MYSPSHAPQPIVGSNIWANIAFQNEHPAYSNGVYSQCGPEATFEHSSFDTNPMSRDEKPLAMSSLDYAVPPVDIGPAVSLEPSFIPLAPEVGTHGILDIPFDSSPVPSFQGDSSFQQWLPEQHSAHSLSPEILQGYSEIAAKEPWEYDFTLAEGVEANPYGHGAYHFGELEPRSIQRKHRYEASAYRIEGQDTRFMCTVENCGKNFSGEWEKTRHIKSMHCPPTIGCRKCNYKQSRKDLFSEHCKKRHPGESIEELRVQLDVQDA
ncbi:hypothetical protein EI94DRAFT_441077 [Lactarius quietus]|nr:hypothetical protein EI94DRAFT_441077 [Lactarius quietus]